MSISHFHLASATHGILQLLVGPDEKSLIENIPSRRTTRKVELRLDGLLIEGKRPWLSARDIPSGKTVSSLAVNCYLLELVHEKLLSFFLQINFDKIRRLREEHQAGDVSEDEILAVSCQDLARDDETPQNMQQVENSPRRIGSMRLETFLRLLEHLRCEVRGSRGSEVVVFRPGGKMYRLGHRKEVRAELVKNVLARLGISTKEWHAAVYK